MSQFDIGDIDPAATSGTELANSLLEPWRDALHSMHKGSSRPSYATAGMLWIDDSGTPWILKLFDGTADRSLAHVNASDGTVRWLGVVGSQSTPVTSVDATTIREGGTRVMKDVGSPADNALIRADGTSGHQAQPTGVIVDDNDNISGYGQKIDVKTADFTLAAADKGKTLECNKASAFTVTVPTNANVALAVGYSVTVVQAGAGTVSFSGQSGVTIRSKEDNTSLDAQWAAATLYKRATDEWVLVGDLA